ncbi:unnamed protein product, partial [Medioppia subpectinata]
MDFEDDLSSTSPSSSANSLRKRNNSARKASDIRNIIEKQTQDIQEAGAHLLWHRHSDQSPKYDVILIITPKGYHIIDSLVQIMADKLPELTVEVKPHSHYKEQAFYITAADDTLLSGAKQLGYELSEQHRTSHPLTTLERQTLIMHFLNTLRFTTSGDDQNSAIIQNEWKRLKLKHKDPIVPKLIARNLIKQVLPLHNEHTLSQLRTQWVAAFFSPQPLDTICQYFGHKIAIYFAFLGFYTFALIFPAILGIFITFYAHSSPYGEVYVLSFAVLNIVWSTIFLQKWRHNSQQLIHGWNSTFNRFETGDEQLVRRPLFRDTSFTDSLSVETERKLFKYFITYPIIGFCLLFIFGVMIAVFRFQLQFMNSFLSLFYIAFYIGDMDKLQEQLATLLITRQVIGNIKESIVPFVWESYKLSAKLHKIRVNEISSVELEANMRRYDSTFDDYLELIIQFGYVMLFSSTFPMAAVCALINNIIEIRSDAFKLCVIYQRPFGGHRVRDIGQWEDVLNAIAYIAIIVNCALIAKTRLISKIVGITDDVQLVLISVVIETTTDGSDGQPLTTDINHLIHHCDYGLRISSSKRFPLSARLATIDAIFLTHSQLHTHQRQPRFGSAVLINTLIGEDNDMMDTEMDCDPSDGSAPSGGGNRSTHTIRNPGLSFVGGLSSATEPSTPYSTQSLSRRLAPNTIGLHMNPSAKLLLNQRRSSSGIFITSMFGSRFRHLQKLHSEAFLGLNTICLPGLPIGAVFRSSLPATPVATPIHREAFQQFTEQALRERLCRTPSPRKNRGFLSAISGAGDQQMRSVSPSFSQSSAGDGLHDVSDVQPMDIASPIDEPVIEDTKGEESTNGSNLYGGSGGGGGGGEHYFGHSHRLHRTPADTDPDEPPDEANQRRLFVGNISYRGTLISEYGFITFKRVCDVQTVLSADPSELVLDNRQLRVNLAKPKVFKQMKAEVQELSRVAQDTLLMALAINLLENLVDQTVLELVCKRWQSLMARIWSTRSHLSFTSTFFRFEAPAVSCPLLETLVYDSGETTDYTVKILGQNCPNLKSLYLNCCSNYGEEGLWWLLK